MARCTRNDCRRWRPDILVRYAGVGLQVDGGWFCSPACVESVTEQRLRSVRGQAGQMPPVPTLRLGVLLLHQGVLTSADLAKALAAQRLSGRQLGAELLHLGLADVAGVLRGLAAQAGVSYLPAVDPVCVRNAPGGLSLDEVRALGVVPIHVDESNRTLVVACQAPMPRAALSTLRQLTGWTPEPLLVSDADWQILRQNYGTTAAPSRRRVAFTRVQGAGDAAARIAATAARGGAVTVTAAHGESSVMVRVETPDAIDTLMMRHDSDTRDIKDISEWPAATTSH
jgi:hypothetical protein